MSIWAGAAVPLEFLAALMFVLGGPCSAAGSLLVLSLTSQSCCVKRADLQRRRCLIHTEVCMHGGSHPP